MKYFDPRSTKNQPSDATQSYTPTPITITAADAIKLVQEVWTDLPASKQRDLISALHTISRVVGVPENMLVLDPTRLRHQVVQTSDFVWDVKSQTKSNVLSRIRRVLERLDIVDPIRKPRSKVWAAQLDLLDDRARMSLVSLARFCDLRDIKPVDVADPILQDFEAWLTHRTLNAEPRDMVTAARRHWNEAAKNITGWPHTTLSLASRRQQLLLPLKQMTLAFQESVKAYEDRGLGKDFEVQFGVTTASDPLAPMSKQSAGFKPMRPITMETKIQRIKVAANALIRSGKPAEEILSINDLATPLAHPKAILNQLWQENDQKLSPNISHIASLLEEIGRYHAGCPETHIKQLSMWRKNFSVTDRYKSMTTRNRKLIEQLSSESVSKKLYLLPSVLFDEATDLGLNMRAAVAAMRGVLIEVLLKCPMRLGNLLLLRLDEHFIRPDPTEDSITAIVIPPEQTKNNVALVYPLSAKTSALLTRWLREFRSQLADPDSPYVFPGVGKNPMTRQGMRDTIKKITRERLGIAINPHAFRHLAGKTLLIAHPGAMNNVKLALGHKSITTGERSYVDEEQAAAISRLDKIIENERESLRRRKKSKKRKPHSATKSKVLPRRTNKKRKQ